MTSPTDLAETFWGAMLLGNGSLWHYALWGGLIPLCLAPAVLSRTRWSESRPILVCVALSLCAHLLFMAFAYATRLPYSEYMRSTPGNGDGPVISLNIFGDSTDADAVADPSDTADASDSADSNNERQSLLDDSKPFRLQAKIDEAQQPGPPPPDLEPLEPAKMAADEATAKDEDAQREDSDESEQRRAAPTLPDRLAASPAPPDLADRPPPSPPVPMRPTVPAPMTTTPMPVADVPMPPAAPPSSTIPLPPPREFAEDGRPMVEMPEVPPSVTPPPGIVPPPVTPAPQSVATGDMSPPAPSSSTIPRATDSTMGPMPAVDAERPAPASSRMVSVDPRDDVGDVARPVRPGDRQPIPQLYRNRVSTKRAAFALRVGGNADTEASVQAALEWLAKNQSSDGHWDAATFGAGRENRLLGQDRGGAGAHADTGITSLALLAMLGAGETHLQGARRERVQLGLEYLLRSQRPDGDLGGSAELFARMYCHSMSTLALSEAYAMTGDDRIRPYLERAVRYTIAAQDPVGGGWRYRPGDEGDMSQFGWQLMALKSAQLCGLDVPERTRSGMRRFLDRVSSGPQRGLASYRPGERPSPTMTAEALVCRLFLESYQDGQIVEAQRYLAESPPQASNEDFYYWYYGTLALFQTQGEAWENWNQQLQRHLLSRQRADGDLAGSWDPDTKWGSYGGRVFSTALGALCLEVYYRYLPLYQTAQTDSGFRDRR